MKIIATLHSIAKIWLLKAFLIPFLSTTARAEVDPIRHLLKAHSSAELSRHIAIQQKAHHQGLVCDSQLKTGKIPAACFKVLHAEVQSGNDEMTVSPSRLPWLEELCEKRAKLSKDWRELDEAAVDAELPRSCRKTAGLRLEDLRYAAQTENPAELFKRRFADRSAERPTR